LAQIRFKILLLSVAALTGCSLAGGPVVVDPSQRDDSPSPDGRREGPRPTSGRESSAPSSAGEAPELAIAVVETAYEAIGTPYQWGGNGANGFDCSGLIRYAYGQFGIELPRISRDQLAVGSPVELRVGALEPGDVLGFSAVVGGEATHVGLYIGDGQFLHSSTSGVRVSDIRQPYWQQHFMAARRMVG
jgi:cell wall-associated NlpC family hydrolase